MARKNSREQRKTLLLVDLPNIYMWAAKQYENPPEIGAILDALIDQARKRGPLMGVLVFVSSNLPAGILMEHLREARRRTPLVIPGPERGEPTSREEPTFAIPGVALKFGEQESDPTDKALMAFGGLLLRAGEIEHYILATGDGDFTDLVNMIEFQNKTVEIFRPDLATTHPNLRERSTEITLPSDLNPSSLAEARTMLRRIVGKLPMPEGLSPEDQQALMVALLENFQVITNRKELTFRELSQQVWGYLRSEWAQKGLRLECCEGMLNVLFGLTDLAQRSERFNATGKRVNIVYSYNRRSRLAELLRHPELIV